MGTQSSSATTRPGSKQRNNANTLYNGELSIQWDIKKCMRTMPMPLPPLKYDNEPPRGLDGLTYRTP